MESMFFLGGGFGFGGFFYFFGCLAYYFHLVGGRYFVFVVFCGFCLFFLWE